MRENDARIREAIEWLLGQRFDIALIALCDRFEQISEPGVPCDLLEGVDDCIRLDQLSASELSTRVTSARRRRIRENRLLHERSLLQSLLDNVSDCIFFKDRQSRFTKVNRQMALTYGREHASLVSKSDFDLFSHEHADAAYRDEQEIIRTGRAMEPKLEKETFKDGGFKWVHTEKVPLQDEHGRIIGTMGIARDVTELKQAQDSLRSEHSMLRTIIDHALAGIFVKDWEGRYLLVNKQHVAYLGATAEADVLGKTLYDFIERAEAERISAFDREIMSSGQEIENMVDFRKQTSGGEFWLLTSKVPLRDDLGAVVGLVGISLDITRQKEVEAELKATIRLLEETKLQLIEAEKLKTVGRLAAGVAHEVKNPLNVISLGAEYLESNVEGCEELLEVLKDMRTAVNKANEVIFELLDYACPHKLRLELGDINTLIRSVISLMRHNFVQAGVSVVEALSDAVEPVRLDAQKMEQVFINIFLNAINAMSNGGTLIVRSQMTQMTAAGPNLSGGMNELFRVGDPILMIEVIDTGTGLSNESMGKAFDPFYSTQNSGQGNGLGLSVSKSIVDLHHGQITLTNREDHARGACVRLLLPANPSE